MAKKAKQPEVEFTDDEKKLIQQAALGVWDECAYDCLQATASEENKPIERVSLKRDVVIEIALDASRPEERLKRQGHAELAKKMDDAPYEQLIRIVKPVFPFGRYGL